MSETVTTPSEMTRDELEDEVEDLRSRLGDLEDQVDRVESNFTHETVLNNIISALVDDDLDRSENPMAHLGAVEDLGERISDIENTLQRHESQIEEGQAVATDRQGTHWQRVVETATNLDGNPSHDLPGDWVKLYKENIQSATGLSERRAGQLIDEWTNENSGKHKNGTRKQDYQPPTAGNNNSIQKKAIKVDLSVWGDA